MAVVKGFGFAGSDRPAGKGDGGRGLGSCGGRRHMAGDGTACPVLLRCRVLACGHRTTCLEIRFLAIIIAAGSSMG